ncbi:hypothetical protein FRB95_012048 [Tulasnella sp. JGI-2019a]|nr:hypothetical protein FRB93_009994 [Tulasnella sp. JGI-2019a]KAG9024135.1 hypothetical protein FRB95_012048 [Tulasnella sp. JGI-2019a]
MAILPRISYPLTRDFQWRMFNVIVYVSIILVLAVLVPLNIALVGYQVVSGLSPDYVVTQSHWYDRFTPSRFKSSQNFCDPHPFATGDSFVTNQTIFDWNIKNLQTTSVKGYNGITYAGITLDECDIVFMGIDANLMTETTTFKATVACMGDFQIYATTSFVATTLMAVSTAVDATWRIQTTNSLVTLALDFAGISVLNDLQNMWIRISGAPVMVSASSIPVMCPRAQMTVGIFPNCDISSGYEIPQLNISYSSMITTNYSYLMGDRLTRPIEFYNSSVNNALQTLHAAVRFDLGNALPNNLFTNTTAVLSTNQTIIPTFPIEAIDSSGNKTVSSANSRFYDLLTGAVRMDNGSEYFSAFPLDGSKRSTISVPFLCRFLELKSPGNAFISVLVATLSMFSAGWTVFILICGYFAKRGKPQANQCETHDTPSGLQYQHLQTSLLEAGMSPMAPGSAQKLAYQ